MARYTGPSTRISRRFGQYIVGSPKVLERRNFPPGQHGPKSRRKLSEYAVGLNYYFKRQLIKWQTDIGMYKGGDPSAGGSSAAGFIAGVDGWLLRSQLQVAW